jgi:hypothetical protein
MGYTADLTTITNGFGNTEIIVLKADRLHLVWETLKAGEADCIGGHLSWCAPMSTYEHDPDGIGYNIIDLFEQYGFEYATEFSNGDIRIGWWGGDKIGLSFETFMTAISVGIDPTEEIRTFWTGEDGDMWAVRHHNQTATQHAVTLGIEL